MRPPRHKNQPQDFGDLRSLLHACPDAQRWDELCAMLDTWPCERDLMERALPYARAQLGMWPDALRKISPDARAQCITRHPPVCTALCLDLDLSYHYFLPAQRITNTNFARMTRAAWFGASATHLSLSNHPVGDEAIASLIDSPLLEGIEHLTLDYTCVSHKGLEALSRAPNNYTLTSLSLANLDLDDRAVKALTRGHLLQHLKTLNISRNHISDYAITLLTQLDGPLAMEHLDIAFNKLTDEGAFLLAATQLLPHISRLAMDYNDVGMAGWRALMHAPHLWHAEVTCYPVR